VQGCFGVYESALQDCQVPDLGSTLFCFRVVAGDFGVDTVRTGRAGGCC
jgi:hypothetical protein